MKEIELVDNEVRRHLYDVLEGVVPVDDFMVWFVSRTSETRTPLVARVDHLLAERSLLDESRLLEELRGLAMTIIQTAEPRETETSSSSLTIRAESIHGTRTIRDRLEFADT